MLWSQTTAVLMFRPQPWGAGTRGQALSPGVCWQADHSGCLTQGLVSTGGTRVLRHAWTRPGGVPGVPAGGTRSAVCKACLCPPCPARVLCPGHALRRGRRQLLSGGQAVSTSFPFLASVSQPSPLVTSLPQAVHPAQPSDRSPMSFPLQTGHQRRAHGRRGPTWASQGAPGVRLPQAARP